MTFEEIIDAAAELLQRRGRLTYRALKRQFQLDDGALEDLCEELIKALRVAVDEGGEVLVWSGGGHATGPVPIAQSSSVLTGPIAGPIADQASHTNYAERRQITVMFCDLVDSTSLSGRMDPEDLRDLVHAYQSACDKVTNRFEGHIAQYLGDGILVYFGYPRAHEDDAQRAVRSGLGIIEAMQELNTELYRKRGIELAVRIGIHTGLVVVGDVGGSRRREQLALGEAPNVAARLQGLAAPNTVLVSGSTHRLIQGYFECRELGSHTLKGVAAPVPVYQVLEAADTQARIESSGWISLVGRETEVEQLKKGWRQARQGIGKVALLSGEAGIGKSRVVEALCQYASGDSGQILRFRGSAYHTGTAYYPVAEHLDHRFKNITDMPSKLRALETMLERCGMQLDQAVPIFAGLQGIALPEKYIATAPSPQRHKQQTHAALTRWLFAESGKQPLLAVFEDLQWLDPATLEFLDPLIRSVSFVPMLVVLTFRPDFQLPWPLPPADQRIDVRLGRLRLAEIAQMVEQITGGKSLPKEVLEQIAAKTDGVPLFVEEVTKLLLETDLLRESNERYELTAALPPLAIPTTLHDSLMARLDRLPMAREIAQLGATLGREFSYQLIAAVTSLSREVLDEGLRRLVEAELLNQSGEPPGATYNFKHALIQEIAYQSLLKSTRQRYHKQIALVLEEHFPDIRLTQPELVAHHYSQAGASLQERAVHYWRRAGEEAMARCAHAEAVEHLSKAIESLEATAQGSAARADELMIYSTLGAAMLATKCRGPQEVEEVFTHVRELYQARGDSLEVFPAMYALWRFSLLGADYNEATTLARAMLRLAESASETSFYVEAARAAGSTLFYLGEFGRARDYFVRSAAQVEVMDTTRGLPTGVLDTWVGIHGHHAWALWFLGYADQARAEIRQAIQRAEAVDHPFSLALALSFACWLFQFCGDRQATREYAERAIAVSKEQGFPLWLSWSTLLKVWAVTDHTGVERSIELMHQGLRDWHTTGSNLGRSYFLSLLATAYARSGEPEDALDTMTEAESYVEERGEAWWEAELYRLRGEFMMQSGASELQVERRFRKALEVARRQGAVALELRAALSLAKLYYEGDRIQEAHALLSEVYGHFSEGFDTADLREAQHLLEELDAELAVA